LQVFGDSIRIASLPLEEKAPSRGVINNVGRLPNPTQLAGTKVVNEPSGCWKRAFAVIRRITDAESWEAIAQRRREDILVYLALTRFGKRPKLSQLLLTLQRDMNAFFGAYLRARTEANALLFQAGDATAIDAACQRSKIAKLLPDDLYVHKSALDSLTPILRIYEGCGRAYLGEVEGANIIKIHRRSGKLSYLVYPDFETDPHPSLLRCIKLNLRTRQIECYDYAQSPNPPILHRKESFLLTDHELYAKFARLTAQEEKLGLLDNASTIGTRKAWAERLRERGFSLQAHRLLPRASAGYNTASKR
jgi:DNA phosphorothioation-associated putative methyltransferase